MFNYYNLFIHVFIDCILFKWKLYLHLYSLKYVCILLGMGAKIIRLFENYQII